MTTARDLVDVFPVRLSFEEGESGKVVIRGPFGHCGNPTSNGRLYGKPIMEREFQRLKESMSSRRMFGELDHPADGKTSLKRVSHIVTGLKIAEDGEVVGELEPLPTPMGDILKALAKAGCELGVSSRGRGSVVTRDDGVDEVQEDFVLKTYDVVDNPASKNAFPSVVESEQVSTFLESIDEEHRDDVRQAFEEAAAKIDTFTLEDIKDEGLRAQVSEALGLSESESGLETGLDAAVAAILDEGAALTKDQAIAQLEAMMDGFHMIPTSIQSKIYKTIKGKKYAEQQKVNLLLKRMKAIMAEGAPSSGGAEVSEEVRPGQYFVLVDVSKPGGKMVSELIKGSKAADRQAEKARKGGKDIQVIDAKWYGPAAEILKATGMSESDETDFVEPVSEENERLKSALAESLAGLRNELREELEVQVRAELLSDPSVAAAKQIVEQIVGMIRPLFPVGAHDAQAARENTALKDALKTRDFDLAVSKMEADAKAKDADSKILEAHLLTRIAGHPKADSIQKMIGPIDRVESRAALDERIDAAFEAMGTPESHITDEDAVRESERAKWEAPLSEMSSEVETLKRRLAKKSADLTKAVNLGEELESERCAADARAEALGLSVYAAEQCMLPGQRRFLVACERAESEEDVDTLLEAHKEDAANKEELLPVRERVRRSVSRTDVSEDEVPRQVARPSAMFIDEGIMVDLAEAATLAGVPSTANNRR